MMPNCLGMLQIQADYKRVGRKKNYWTNTPAYSCRTKKACFKYDDIAAAVKVIIELSLSSHSQGEIRWVNTHENALRKKNNFDEKFFYLSTFP